VCFRDDPALVALLPAAPEHAFALPEVPRARPPSPPTEPLAMFTRMTGLRFSGSGERPTTSATALPTHGHTPEHPILANFNAPFVVTLNVLSLPPHLFGVRFLRPALLEPAFGAWWPSPVEEGFAIAASRCNPFVASPAALQARDKT